MKLLIISSNSPYYEFTGPALGGAEASLRIVAERFAERGHEVHFLTQGNLIGSRNVMHEGVKIHFIPPIRIPGFGLVSDHICKLNKRMYSSLMLREVERIVRENGIEIIHTYVTLPDTHAAAVVGKRYNIPVVQRIAGKKTIQGYLKIEGQDNKERWTFENVDHFLPISEYLKDEFLELMKLKKTEKGFTILEIGMKVPEEKPRPLLKREDGKFIITSVSSFKRYAKRQDIIIDAVEMLSKERKDFRVQFIGSGDNLKALKNAVNRKELDDFVVFRGLCSRSDVIKILKSSHFFVHATESEGLGKAVMESMACGVPVIASDVRAINDYIKDGENGFLAKNYPGSFSDRLSYLMDNFNLAENVSDRAHSYALEHFQSRKNIEKYEKLFSSLVTDQ